MIRPAFSAMLLPIIGAAAAGSVISGTADAYWTVEDTTTVLTIGPCGPDHCVTIAGFEDAGGETTPEALAEAKAACGSEVISKLTKVNDSKYTGGTLTDTDTGAEYSANVEIKSGDLHVRAYEGVPAFGVTLIWPAFSGDIARCGDL